MIILECEQRSPEWFRSRLGLPTASSFDKILTPGGKPSTQADAYAHILLAEWLTGEQGGMEGNQWMARGTEMEPEARGYYEILADAAVMEVGLCLADCRRYGCSPDGLVGDEGLLEIKCPAPHTHVQYLLDGGVPSKYIPQIQGQLLVTGRAWCDFLSYSPLMPSVRIRVERDEKYISTLNGALEKFAESLEGKRQRLIDQGVTPIAYEVPDEALTTETAETRVE